MFGSKALIRNGSRPMPVALWVYAPHLRLSARKWSGRLHFWQQQETHPTYKSPKWPLIVAHDVGRAAGTLFRLREAAYDARPHNPLRPRHSIEGRSGRPLLPSMIPTWGR
jgi:hypothetical protein